MNKMKTVCNHTGKTIFCNEADARVAVGFMKHISQIRTYSGRRIKHRRRKVRQKRVYYCLFCQGYHLTKCNWWRFGSKKQQELLKKRYENDFII